MKCPFCKSDLTEIDWPTKGIFGMLSRLTGYFTCLGCGVDFPDSKLDTVVCPHCWKNTPYEQGEFMIPAWQQTCWLCSEKDLRHNK